MDKVLVVDDEPQILEIIDACLSAKGYSVTMLEGVREGYAPDIFSGYDLIILDIMMPGVDGYTLVRELRGRTSCPILFLSAKVGEQAVVQGLMTGADDYLIKPFGLGELVARVEAHIRRARRPPAPRTLSFGHITLDFDARLLLIGHEVLALTPYEFSVCELLASRRNRVIPKEELHALLYESNFDTDAQVRIITEYVYSIRKKMMPYGIDPIETVWGIGYRWRNG